MKALIILMICWVCCLFAYNFGRQRGQQTSQVETTDVNLVSLQVLRESIDKAYLTGYEDGQEMQKLLDEALNDSNGITIKDCNYADWTGD